MRAATLTDLVHRGRGGLLDSHICYLCASTAPTPAGLCARALGSNVITLDARVRTR